MNCPFGQPVGDEGAVDGWLCPEWSSDCACKLELLRHSTGYVDAQTTYVSEWWSNVAHADCDHGPRALLPEFSDGDHE